MSASKWKPYLDYRVIPHAGIDKIPNHWDSKRMRYVFMERGEVSEDGTEELLSVSKYTGVKVRSTTTDREARAASLVGYKKCEPNDIVSNIMLAWDSALGVAFDSGIVSSAYEVYVPQQEIDPHFLDLLLRTPEYRVAFTIVSKGIVPSRWRMYTESFNDIQMILPPLNEQKQIGVFVHRINENISRNIENLETQLSLLEEKRSALITKAVTKGLNPDVPMKDSGMETLGQLPSTWELKQIKHTIQPKGIVRGPFGSSLKTSFFVKEGYKVYQQKNAIYQNITLGKAYIDDQKFSELSRFSIRENDFLMSCSGTIGRTYLVPENFEPGVINQALMIIRYNREYFDYEYLSWLMNSSWFQTQIIDNSQGGAMKNIVGIEIFKGIKIPIPPIKQQIEISSFLTEKVQRIEQTQIHINAEIKKLKEYRTALISAAATGKIDVRSL